MATDEMTAQLMRENEALRAELERARAHVGNAARLLSGIYALMYPAPITTQDGRTMVFRPKSPDPHEVLQELSDRIRALPAEMAKAGIEPHNAGGKP